MTKQKYVELRKNQEIARWFNEVKRGSETTAKTYMRRLGNFCKVMKIDPFYLLKMKDKQLSDLISDYITKMEDMNHAGGYISSTMKGLKSWLSYNGIRLQRKIKIKNVQSTPTLEGKAIFSQEGLKKILDSTDIRGKVAISMVAFTGIRLESLGNEKGTDGIMIKDIEGLTIDRNGVRFESIPAKITIRKTISKKENEYFTFLGQEGCEYVLLYLNERINQGEQLTENSPLLTYAKIGLRNKSNGFVTRIKVSELIRKAIRTAGFENRPYDLRPYFASRLLRAEDDRLMNRDYRVFFMGHKGGIEHVYTLHRKVSNDMETAMKEAYARSFKYLQSRPAVSPEEKESLEKGLAETLFKKYLNFSEQEALELLDLPDDERRKIIEQKIGRPQDKDNIRLKAENDKKEIENRNSGSRQKVIPIDYVETYMDLGFEFVSQLGSDRAIMRLP
jgi:integrase